MKRGLRKLELEEMIRKITEEVYGRLKTTPEKTEPGDGANRLEYAVMDPAAKIQDIRAACETVRTKGLSGICVPQWFVGFAVETLKGSGIAVLTFAALPGGLSSTYAKYAEVKEAVKNGAAEVCIPVNMDLVKKGRLDIALNDLNEAMVPAKGRARVTAVVEYGAAAQETEAAIDVAIRSAPDAVGISCVMSGQRPGAADVKKFADRIRGKAGLKIIGGIDSAAMAKEIAAAGAAKLITSCICY